MARRLRIQYPGALYHIINRGNYRSDIFATAGAVRSFLGTLAEACTRHGWRVHAHVIMRNHFHLALETPTPNLVAGMHWLQGTFASRFNRFRAERGHLFQGRYQAILLQDAAALLRVADYIHLNPVRARLVTAAQVGSFPRSSLAQFMAGARPTWLIAETLLGQLGMKDTREGWERYIHHLADLANDPVEQRSQGFPELTRGWAIGTPDWKRALAELHAKRRVASGFSAEELRDLATARWRTLLEAELRLQGKSATDLAKEPMSAPWKLAIAARLRREGNAPHRWIADTLNLRSAGALRVAFFRMKHVTA